MSQPPTDPAHDLIFPDNPDPPHESGPLGVRSFGMTDRGLMRPSNEDQFLIAVLTKALGIQQSSLPLAPAKYADDQGHIFLVADGLGGGPAGKEASALAVKSSKISWSTRSNGFSGSRDRKKTTSWLSSKMRCGGPMPRSLKRWRRIPISQEWGQR